MFSTDFLIPALFFLTFAIAIGWGISQYVKVTKAKRNRTQSASAKANGEPVAPAPTSARR